jgi:ABC-2 type transport system permease protein
VSGSFVTLLRLLLRLQLTPLRALGALALGLLAVALGALVGGVDDPVRTATEVVVGYGLGIAIPLACAWMATSVVGDLVEDRLLVYLWLKPVPRWQLPVAAVVATIVTVVPLLAVPLVVAQVVAGASELVVSVAAASLLATAAYSALFVAAGLWFRRALWWALVYILVWENGFARAVDGAARLSIASCAESLVAHAGSVQSAYADRSTTAAVAVPAVVVALGVALAIVRYRRAEVD